MIKLAPADKSQVYRAFMEAFADYAMDASGTREASLMLRMAKNNVDFDASVGAYEGDHLIGFTLIGIDEMNGETCAFDAGTGIVPEFRKQGLAKAMFDHALPALRERGVQRFILEVLQENEPAIKAYRKSGFEISRELKCFVAEKKTLQSMGEHASISVQPIDASTFEAFASEADWTPSFENRFSSYRAIPDDVVLLGAFVEGSCVGTLAYCEKLNWLLSLIVKRSERRRGVGKSLLRHLGTIMPEPVAKLAALNVDGQDAGMQAFFEAIRFSHFVDQYEMSRPL